jgi:hypothetical protein
MEQTRIELDVQEENHEQQEQQEDHKKIYRYKFHDDFITEISKFSKIHQYDDRHTFKEAWNVWVEEHKEMVDAEVSRHVLLNYTGDVLDKMFKSARYYFRKKVENVNVKPRKPYSGVQPYVIQMMDIHISDSGCWIKPSKGFSDFMSNNGELVAREVEYWVSQGLEKDEVEQKIKKAFKNRCFILKTKEN